MFAWSGANATHPPQLQAVQMKAAQLEQSPAERSIVSRQEARIRDLESQLDFQAVQMRRFEVPGCHRSWRGCGIWGGAVCLQKADTVMAPPWLCGEEAPGKGWG